MREIKLSERAQIPQLGFGTWKLRGNQAREAVLTALEVGYRHIDTADFYGNHKEIRKAIGESGIKEDEIFITSKVWRTHLHRQEVIGSVKRFLEELGREYLDLVLIHWPNSRVPIEETLDAMIELQEQNLISEYGVSNFTIPHLQEILDKGYDVANNQVELHPSFKQTELREFCHRNDIKVTAYSPLGKGKDLKLKTILDISKKYSCSTAQVVLSWLLERGLIAVPRSSNPKHIKENYEAINLELEDKDIQRLDNIDDDDRITEPKFAEFDYTL